MFGAFKRNSELPWIVEAKSVFGLHESRNKTELTRWLGSDGKRLGDTEELPWCFEGGVEILTEDGWQRLDNIQAKKVCQVDKDGTVSLTDFVHVEKDYNGKAYKIKSKRISLISDINHKWWGNWGHVGENRKPTPDCFGTLDKLNCHGLTIRPFMAHDEKRNMIDEKLHMLAAFISDGFFHRNKIEFQVSKERKIDLLKTLNPTHIYKSKKTYKEITKTPMSCISFNIPEWFDEIFTLDYKQIPIKTIMKWSKTDCQQFLKYYSQYDGSVRADGRITLYTSDEYTKDMLITIIGLAGYNPNIENGGQSKLTKKQSWRIGFTEKILNHTLKKKNIKEIDYIGKMYCVTVPESRIIVRGDNKLPVVTGNCGDYVETAIKRGLPDEPFVGPLGENPYWARNWLYFGESTQPVYGCVLVFSRGSGGHVGFAVGEDENDYYVLGGNQSNSVNISRISKGRLLGARWPETYKNPMRKLPHMSADNIPKTTNEF